MITDNSTKNVPFKYDAIVFVVPIILVISIWFVYWVEFKFDLNFNKFGIYPRTLKGLRGIFLSPFIHAGPQHLFNNTSPLIVLIASLLYFYRKISLPILIYGTILTGFFTWVIARPAYHIGISGVIYMLVSFIFFSGIIRKYYRLVALSLIIVFLYGSTIWYIFPIKEEISWEGHLAGFLVGLFFAFFYRKTGPQRQTYIYKETEFDTYFDSDGNFKPPAPEDSDSVDLNTTSTTFRQITFKSDREK